MSAGLVVELERLAAEAALCRAQLEEIGHLLGSCRQRIHEGAQLLEAPPLAEPIVEEVQPHPSETPPPHDEPVEPVATPFSISSPDFDPTWGAGGG